MKIVKIFSLFFFKMVKSKLLLNYQIVFVNNKIMDHGLLWMCNFSYTMNGMQSVMTMNICEYKEQTKK
jgi:hypothetical protein